MKLKVCGLSKSSDVKNCILLNVDYCGFILNYPKSHRCISFNKARDLTNIKKGNTNYVGVLVEPTEEELIHFSKLNFDYFQIYGDFNSEKIKKIKKKTKKKIISSIQVIKKEDVFNYEEIKEYSDIILWDSSGYQQSIKWDYSWIKAVSVKKEKMIAGNITIDKIHSLKNLADTVDVSGALETNKVKDINKIKKFAAEVKKINDEN